MDITKVTLHSSERAASCNAQARIESAVPVPEGKSVARVLCCSPAAHSDTPVVSEKAVDVGGRLTLLILAEDAAGETFGFEAEAEYQHRIPCPEAAVGLTARVQTQILECRLRADEGSLRLSGIIALSCELMKQTETACVGELAGVRGLELVTRREECSRRVLLGALSLRQREEFDIPEGSSPLQWTGQIKELEVKPAAGGYNIEGSLELRLLLTGVDGVLYERSRNIAFSGETDGEPGEDPYGEAEITRLAVRVYSDEDCILEAELQLSVSIYGTQHDSVSLLCDGYDADNSFSCHPTLLKSCDFAGRQLVSIPQSAVLSVPGHLPDCGMVVCARACPAITETSINGRELTCEGMLLVTVLYRGDDGRLHSFTEDVPFSVNFEAREAAGEPACFIPKANLCELRVGGSGNRLELRCALKLGVELYTERTISCVTELARGTECDPHTGILIYFADDGDTLFSVGKRFLAPQETIRALNPNAPNELHNGDRLVIMR